MKDLLIQSNQLEGNFLKNADKKLFLDENKKVLLLKLLKEFVYLKSHFVIPL